MGLQHLRRRFFQCTKGALGACIKHFATLGQANALSAAFTDPAFQYRLQKFYLMADRRCAHAEDICRALEAELFRQRMERP